MTALEQARLLQILGQAIGAAEDFPIEDAVVLGLTLPEIRQAAQAGVKSALGLRRVEKNSRFTSEVAENATQARLAALLEEMQGTRDSVEQLYLVLDHLCRNREEIPGELSADEGVEWTLTCRECNGNSPSSLALAISEGWLDIVPEDFGGWNFLGSCPNCERRCRLRKLRKETEKSAEQSESEAVQHPDQDGEKSAPISRNSRFTLFE